MTMYTSYTKLSRRLITGLGIILSTLVFWSGQSVAMPMISIDQTVDGGTLSYNGSGGVLTGTDIRFDFILGVDTPLNNGVSLTCDSCKLNFETGVNLSQTTVLGSRLFQWDGGGFFRLTGTVKDSLNNTIASGTTVANPLLQGTWDAPVTGQRTGASFQVIGTGANTFHTDLQSFFGLTSAPFAFLNSELSSKATGSGFAVSATVNEADIVSFTPTPEPTTLVLIGAGLLGLVGYRWRQTPVVKA